MCMSVCVSAEVLTYSNEKVAVQDMMYGSYGSFSQNSLKIAAKLLILST